MRRRAPLPMIRYEIRGGELRARGRVVVLEVPLGTERRNALIRKLARKAGPKELAEAFGLQKSQVHRILNGQTSGTGRRRGRAGETKL